MVSVCSSGAIDRGLESRPGQSKIYKIGICRFSANDVAVRNMGQNLVNSESGLCGRVERHVYKRTVVSVN